ncbi:MAG: hypothetical protein ACHRHE_18300 [Tepidisphaerales bacterium]
MIVRLIAAVVALALLGAIGYLLNHLTSVGGNRLERVVDGSDGEIRDHRSHGIEPARENAMSLATLPWIRDSNNPEPARVELGGQPYVHRTRARAAVPLAYLPAIRPRHDLDRPTPATIRSAEVPWGRLTPAREVKHIEPAVMPRLVARRDPEKPVSAGVSPASLPWGRNAQSPLPAEVSAAKVPSALKSTTPK